MISIETIIAVASAFMFAALVIPFIVDVGDSAQQEGLGSFEISETEQMAELIMHTTLISYVCTEESEGGYHAATQTVGSDIYLTSWQNYDDMGVFDNLEENSASRPLDCHGSPNKLPLSEGLTDAFLKGVGVGADNWIDSQKGQYSRQEFVVDLSDTDDESINIPRCIHLEGVDSSTSKWADGIVWAITDNTYDSTTRMTRGEDIYNSCEKKWGSPDFSTNVAGQSFVGHFTTNVIAVEDLGDDFYTSPRTKDSNDDNYPDGGGSLTTLEYTLCHGTTGYVQSNPGTNEEAEAPAAGGFSVEDNIIPGVPDRTTGGEDEVNRPHPYIVITSAPDDCL